MKITKKRLKIAFQILFVGIFLLATYLNIKSNYKKGTNKFSITSTVNTLTLAQKDSTNAQAPANPLQHAIDR